MSIKIIIDEMIKVYGKIKEFKKYFAEDYGGKMIILAVVNRVLDYITRMEYITKLEFPFIRIDNGTNDIYYMHDDCIYRKIIFLIKFIHQNQNENRNK